MAKLTPVDRKRCQVKERPGYNFMTFGIPDYYRCEKPAVWIAKENKPGLDGKRGSMSLCDEHKAVFLEKLGSKFAKLTRIRRKP